MKIKNIDLILKRGDITEEEVDVIVNAANSGLMGGGGVDGAIHKKGGPSILAQCREIRSKQGKCLPGHAVRTAAGNLKAKHVVHTVGPIWYGGMKGEAEILRNAYRNSLTLADGERAASVAFPSISTGAYRYPVEKAASVALETCFEFAQRSVHIREIRFILFSDSDLEEYQEALKELS